MHIFRTQNHVVNVSSSSSSPPQQQKLGLSAGAESHSKLMPG